MHGAPGRPSRPPASRKSKRRAAAEGHAPGIHEVSAGGSNPRAQRGPSADKTSIRPLSQRRNIAKLAACDTRIKARKALDTRFHAAARSRLDLEHRRRLLFVGARSFIFLSIFFFPRSSDVFFPRSSNVAASGSLFTLWATRFRTTRTLRSAVPRQASLFPLAPASCPHPHR